MPTIRYIESSGVPHAVAAEIGMSVMAAARQHGIHGIVADCGGTCSCATCHVHVDPAWFDRLAEPSEMERAMLEFATDPGPNSRLSCQIRISEALDGLTVSIPATQY
jgi:2Fe-2S ferredoxin